MDVNEVRRRLGVVNSCRSHIYQLEQDLVAARRNLLLQVRAALELPDLLSRDVRRELRGIEKQLRKAGIQ